MSEINEDVELIRSNKGGLKLIHKGYMYTVHKKRQSGGVRWRCSQRSLQCKGSISTGEGPPKINMVHNHLPDPHSVALARCRQFEEFAGLTPLIEMDCDDSEDSARKKRLVKKVAQNNDDFIYEIEKLDNMLECSKQSLGKEYSRLSKGESKMKFVTSPPTLSPILPPPTQENRTDSDAEEVCLRWNSHHSNMKVTFPSLLQKEQYVDVTLTAEGKSIKCHRLILSSCSAYFDELLGGISPLQHPVIFLNGVSFWILKCLIDFMYSGEVHIEQNKLENLLKVAEMLQIKGLTGKTGSTPPEDQGVSPSPPVAPIKAEKLIGEHRVPTPKKDMPSATATTKSPIKKVLSPNLVSEIDPLSLLEPTFFEENPVPLRFKEQVSKKVVAKKMKKRKLSDHEPSPPPLMYRKGTKSRPHVKIPRYYHNDFEGLDGKKSNRREETISTDISNIKIESLIIETTNMQSMDRRKHKEMAEKTKFRRQLHELKSDVQEEMKSSDDSNSTTHKPPEILTREIKEEQIDLDYAELTNSNDKNVTI